MLLSKENYKQAFQYLDRLLCDYRSVWSESAFVTDELSWRTEYPNLHRDLLALSENALLCLGEEREVMLFLDPYIPGLASVADWHVSKVSDDPWQTPERALFGLPGRKRRQTEGFVTALLGLLKGLEGEALGETGIADWCSGRGLLARQLHYATQAKVVCFERDRALCESGRVANDRLDKRLSAHVTFAVQDVLSPLDPGHFDRTSTHTALHACGDLHLSMIEQTAKARVPVLACSPCCYHSIRENVYAGLSAAGRESALKPTRDELRLATAETCTANAIERELRQRELLWRVAFDLRLRELNGLDEYSPMPSVKKSLLKTSFEEFASWMMRALQKKGSRSVKFFPLTPEAKDDLLQRAQKKVASIRRREKAQLGFRKVIEYWLLLDRVLFLQDQGYDVELQEFCQKKDSGRNTVILASLPAGVRKGG